MYRGLLVVVAPTTSTAHAASSVAAVVQKKVDVPNTNVEDQNLDRDNPYRALLLWPLLSIVIAAVIVDKIDTRSVRSDRRHHMTDKMTIILEIRL
jgi:hypothetical protein